MTVTTGKISILTCATLASLLALSSILGGCSASSAVNSLKAVVDLVEMAIPLIPNLDASTKQLVAVYLRDVSAAADGASNILAGTDSAALKATKITQLFADIVAPKLPGSAGKAIAAVAAVARAVTDFLSHFHVGMLGGAMSPGAQLPHSDLQKLAFIRMKATSNLEKLKGMAR